MDQSTADVAEKTQQPENEKNYKYGPQHKSYFRLISLGDYVQPRSKKDQKQNRNWYLKKPKQDVSCRTCLFDLVH